MPASDCRIIRDAFCDEIAFDQLSRRVVDSIPTVPTNFVELNAPPRVRPFTAKKLPPLKRQAVRGCAPYGVGPKTRADTYPRSPILSGLSETVAGSGSQSLGGGSSGGTDVAACFRLGD